MKIDEQIKGEKMQHSVNREPAKIKALSSERIITFWSKSGNAIS